MNSPLKQLRNEAEVWDGTIVRYVIRVKRWFLKARINNRLFLRSRKITFFKTNIENMRKERCKNRSKLLNKPSGHRVQIRSFVRCSLDQNQNLLWRQGLKCIKVAWLRARRETRRGSIFCSRSHRLCEKNLEKASAVAESGIWLLTFLHIYNIKSCEVSPEVCLLRGKRPASDRRLAWKKATF